MLRATQSDLMSASELSRQRHACRTMLSTKHRSVSLCSFCLRLHIWTCLPEPVCSFSFWRFDVFHHQWRCMWSWCKISAAPCELIGWVGDLWRCWRQTGVCSRWKQRETVSGGLVFWHEMCSSCCSLHLNKWCPLSRFLARGQIWLTV